MLRIFYAVFSLVLFFSYSYAQENYEEKRQELKQLYLDQINKTFPRQTSVDSIKTIEQKQEKKQVKISSPSVQEKEIKQEEEIPQEIQVEQPSLIEQMYYEISGKTLKLQQFGYEFFRLKEEQEKFLPVGEDYVVGPGDTLFLYLWGDPIDILNMEGFYALEIDREGKIFVPAIGVFYVWGMTVKKVKKLLSEALSKKIKNFELELSVGKLREFPVYVAGFVKNPGIVMVTGVNTVLDAISYAGGIDKSGSLRNIILNRKIDGKNKKIVIDLYRLFIYGDPIDIKIKEGDTIYVSPIGKTAAIAGMVKRPAIYEIKDENSLKELAQLAGGFLPSTYKYGIKVYRTSGKQLKIKELAYTKESIESFVILDGDLIVVNKVSDFIENKILVEGYVQYEGLYDVTKYPTLEDLINAVGVYPDTNLFYGEIERIKDDGSFEYITFKPYDVLNQISNIKLKPNDTVRFYKFGDIKSIDFNKFKDVVIISGNVKYPGAYAFEDGLKLSEVLTYDQLLIDTDLKYGEILRKTYPDLDYEIISFIPEQILNGDKDIDLKPMDEIRLFPKWVYKPIEVSGEVYHTKLIPYYDGITLLDALRDIKFKDKVRNLKVVIYEEDGTYKDKYKSDQTKEIKNDDEISFKEIKRTIYLYDLLIKGDENVNIKLKPGYKLVIKRTEETEKDKVVQILGEVKKPGIYKYKAGMKLYDLIKLAGGYTEDAYPKALIFIRQSAKKLQQEQLEASLLAMEESIAQSEEGFAAAGATPEEQQLIKITLEKQKRLFSILKKKAQIGLGRIALDIPNDLEKLRESEDNILLQDGDFVYIPSKPNYVLVLGGVYNQISLPYKEDWKVADYLQEVGGLKENAKESDLFIIKANGRVISKRSVKGAFAFVKWKKNKLMFGEDFYDLKLEQGDTIVVPTKVKVPILWRPLLRDITQIIFQALSTAVLAQRL